MTDEVLQQIADSFRDGKMPRKAIRDEFLKCYAQIGDFGVDQAFKVGSTILAKGKQTTREVNKPGARERCLNAVCDLLLKRATSIPDAIERTAATNKVGKNQLHKWWRDGDNTELVNINDEQETWLFHRIRRSKNRYRKSDWKEQPVRRNSDGKIVLTSLALIPKKR